MKRFIGAILVVLLVTFPRCAGRAGEVRLSFTGDIIMHMPVKMCARAHNEPGTQPHQSRNNRGFDFLFERIRPVFSDSDMVVGNMEFPVVPPFTSKPKIFNCEPDVLSAMKKAGFHVMHIANNHILDQGEAGVVSTMRYLRAYGLDYLGVGHNEAEARGGIVRTLRGIRVGLIGYAGYLNYPLPASASGYRLNWLYNRERVIEDIAAVKKRCDFLIMVAHTGLEYRYRPRERDRELFKEYLNAGVDCIIGHHPHVVQPAERVIAQDGRICYIFYSLGNFISNQSTEGMININGVTLTTRDSIIVRCILSKSFVGRQLDVCYEIVPIFTRNAINGATGRREIQTVLVDDEINALRSVLSASSGEERVDIERRLTFLYQKSEAVKAAVFDGSDLKEVTFKYR